MITSLHGGVAEKLTDCEKNVVDLGKSVVLVGTALAICGSTATGHVLVLSGATVGFGMYIRGFVRGMRREITRQRLLAI